jgi:1-acyl-sn-glycerol-3-phosphate acyltransferase
LLTESEQTRRGAARNMTSVPPLLALHAPACGSLVPSHDYLMRKPLYGGYAFPVTIEKMYNMYSFLYQVRGILSVLYLAINTIFWVTLLLIVTFFKLIIPFAVWRKYCGKVAITIAENWILFNNVGLILTRKIALSVSGIDTLDREAWYLVIANHQSWVDIPVLQKVLYHKIPFLKFFLKKELIWVPFLGQAWWALDFPFMKRYSNDTIRKHPHLKGKDMEITRKACEKFKDNPVSIMNFTEGTRFTKAKHNRQESPFKNLLRPKAGGVGFVLSAMGDQLSTILDITIAYPLGPPNFWDFLCGRVKRIDVQVRQFAITPDLLGDYMDDEEYRVRFQKWLNDLWEEKDLLLERTIRPMVTE